MCLRSIGYSSNFWDCLFGKIFTDSNLNGCCNPLETIFIYVNSRGFQCGKIQYRSKVSWHSKLEPRDSILEPRCSKYSRIESRVLSLESRGSRNKGFKETIDFSSKQLISRRKKNTGNTPKVQVFRVGVIAWKHSTMWLWAKHDFCLRQLVFKTNNVHVDLQSTVEICWWMRTTLYVQTLSMIL